MVTLYVCVEHADSQRARKNSVKYKLEWKRHHIQCWLTRHGGKRSSRNCKRSFTGRRCGPRSHHTTPRKIFVRKDCSKKDVCRKRCLIPRNQSIGVALRMGESSTPSLQRMRERSSTTKKEMEEKQHQPKEEGRSAPPNSPFLTSTKKKVKVGNSATQRSHKGGEGNNKGRSSASPEEEGKAPSPPTNEVGKQHHPKKMGEKQYHSQREERDAAPPPPTPPCCRFRVVLNVSREYDLPMRGSFQPII